MKYKNYSQFLNTFSFKQWLLFYVAIILICISLLSLLYTFQKNNLTQIASSGGTYREGLVGSIRFINPILVTNETEKEVSNLVFRGLFQKDEQGAMKPALADSYTVSEDGLTYTVSLKKDIYFHNGELLTAKDVAFTIKQLKDPVIKSPKQATWIGVETKILNDQTVEFKLKQKYADFLEALSVGIISEEEWKGVTPDQFALSIKNTEPIGAGPYKFSSLEKNKSGLPTTIALQRNKKYIEGTPYIKHITISFFDTEKNAILAFNNKKIDIIAGLTPSSISSVNAKYIEQTPLPRLFGLFFNKNEKPIFQDTDVVKALEYAINKPEIISKVFNGYAQVENSAVPFIESQLKKDFDIAEATSILEKKGWKKNTAGIWEKKGEKLAFTISTTDVEELKLTNLLIQEQLQNFGVEVSVQTYETSALVQDVLNPRKYEVLLFGQVLNKPTNLYSFWHSQERTTPGLNISMYVNQKVDTLLELIRKESDQTEQATLLKKFEAEIESDKPAIFLFRPMYVSASYKQIFNKTYIATPSVSKYFNIHNWSIYTDKVWSIFSK